MVKEHPADEEILERLRICPRIESPSLAWPARKRFWHWSQLVLHRMPLSGNWRPW
jgi:hypothetical protein